MGHRIKAPLIPIPEEGPVDFTKRIRNVSVRYLNSQKPTSKDLEKWIILPLYQKDQDMPLDDDGKTSLLVAHVDVMRKLIDDYEKKMKAEQYEQKKTKRNLEDQLYLEEVGNLPEEAMSNTHLDAENKMEDGEISD